MKVTLTPWEYKAAVDLAVTRLAVSRDRGIKDISPRERSWFDLLKIDVLGAAGEMAVAKVLDKFWTPSVNTMHRIADIGTDIEVRTSTRSHSSLIVRENDVDTRWFYLVVGEPPVLDVKGYILGSEAKRDEWFRDGQRDGYRPAWFVPQPYLTPIEEREYA